MSSMDAFYEELISAVGLQGSRAVLRVRTTYQPAGGEARPTGQSGGRRHTVVVPLWASASTSNVPAPDKATPRQPAAPVTPCCPLAGQHPYAASTRLTGAPVHGRATWSRSSRDGIVRHRWRAAMCQMSAVTLAPARYPARAGST